MRLGSSSIKLQKAYSTFGNPTFEVLVECHKEDLDSTEKEAIEIFDSINNGFNTCLSAGGISSLCGEEHGNSNYTNEQILYVLDLLVDNSMRTFPIISDLTHVSISVISSISALQAHKWLKQVTPSSYQKLEEMYYSGYRVANTKTGIKTSVYYLTSPEGLTYLVTNASKFAKEHKLDKARLGNLADGSRKTHKGWKLCPANIGA